MSDWERRWYHLGEQIHTHLPVIAAVLLVLLAAAVGWACAERTNRRGRTLRAYDNGHRDGSWGDHTPDQRRAAWAHTYAPDAATDDDWQQLEDYLTDAAEEDRR